MIMAKYIASYGIRIQPHEEAPEFEKRNYDIVARDDKDAIEQARNKRIEWLRDELLSGSAVTVERLVEIREVNIK